jgi:hypothetical protein
MTNELSPARAQRDAEMRVDAAREIPANANFVPPRKPSLLRYANQWMLVTIGFIYMAPTFLRMPFDPEERHLVGQNFQLDVRDGDDKPHDGMEDGFDRIGDGEREPHDRKNLIHELCKSQPRVASRMLPFIGACLSVATFATGLAIGWWLA